MNLVVVESPAKARTIEKYLGKDFKVLASYGHIRDLPSKDGAVDPDQDFKMEWAPTENSEKALGALIKAMKEAKTLYLATDPDREGEAISWHICQTFQDQKLLKDKEVHRIAFYEITKKAVLEAIKNPRVLNQELIDAYLARRALDYLVGFRLSPVLWRKLPGSKSAGRVQSVALKLITDRDDEIERFISEEYWSIIAACSTKAGELFEAKLSQVDGKKLEKFSIPNKDQAEGILNRLRGQDFAVKSVEEKQVARNPQPPFTTSTLQQEAARKLGFGATQTMRTAQKLYEGVDIEGETVGLITYMRTDSVIMSADAVTQCRDYIAKNFAGAYSTPAPRVYKTKIKNAQEAHECVRPTDFLRTPKMMAPFLDAQQLKLYDLVWKRAMASQMASAIKNQVGIDLISEDQHFVCRATGSQLVFDGFLTLYEEGTDTQPDEEAGLLPIMKEKDPILQKNSEGHQHFTQPPAKYTEASLVKKLEELGIGRPSTYASILYLLQQRKYVKLEKKYFTAEERGRLVATFLDHYFKKYVEYGFTANLEEQLDDIAQGELKWKDVLAQFWTPFLESIDATKQLKIADVLDVLDAELSNHFFPNGAPRDCPKCKKGKLHLKIGKYGAFIGCEDYPECNYIKKIQDDGEGDSAEELSEYPKVLGKSPAGLEISLRKGPYGFYVQEEPSDSKGKPKRGGLPKEAVPGTFTLEQALGLLALPKVLGINSENQEEISVGIGRFGPYIKHGSTFVSVKKESILELTLERAIEIIEQTPKTKPKMASRRVKK